MQIYVRTGCTYVHVCKDGYTYVYVCKTGCAYVRLCVCTSKPNMSSTAMEECLSCLHMILLILCTSQLNSRAYSALDRPSLENRRGKGEGGGRNSPKPKSSKDSS